jgi:hypothetical protein
VYARVCDRRGDDDVTYRSEVWTLREENEALQRRVLELEEARGRLVPEPVSGGRAAWERLVGGRGELEVEVEVRGKLTEDSATRAIESLERSVGAAASGAQGLYVGSRMTWSSSRSFEQTSNVDVVVSAAGEGRSLVRVRERPARFGVAVYGLLAFWLLPVGGLLATLTAELLRTAEPHPNLLYGIALIATVFALLAVVSRRGLRAWTERRRERVTRWATEVAREIGARPPERVAPRRTRLDELTAPDKQEPAALEEELDNTLPKEVRVQR